MYPVVLITYEPCIFCTPFEANLLDVCIMSENRFKINAVSGADRRLVYESHTVCRVFHSSQSSWIVIALAPNSSSHSFKCPMMYWKFFVVARISFTMFQIRSWSDFFSEAEDSADCLGSGMRSAWSLIRWLDPTEVCGSYMKINTDQTLGVSTNLFYSKLGTSHIKRSSRLDMPLIIIGARLIRKTVSSISASGLQHWKLGRSWSRGTQIAQRSSRPPRVSIDTVWLYILFMFAQGFILLLLVRTGVVLRHIPIRWSCQWHKIQWLTRTWVSKLLLSTTVPVQNDGSGEDPSLWS